MNKNKKYITIVLVLITILFGFIYFNFYSNKSKIVSEFQEKPIELNQKVDIPNKLEITIEEPSFNSPSEIIKEVEVSFVVGSHRYSTEIKKGSNVFDVMVQIKTENKDNFDFKYSEYPYLGIFINEINGVVGSPGAYWIYYVNDKEASVGISNYIINDGDIINWKQE
jgi:hypothetical protein